MEPFHSHSCPCAHTRSDDLWTRAVDTLPNDIKSQINWKREKRETLEELKTIARHAQTQAAHEAWSFSRSNEQKVIVRDVLAKVMKWVNHFKSVGDAAVQYDPAHAALPWAGFRFLLNVCPPISLMFLRLHAVGRGRRCRSVRQSPRVAPCRGRNHLPQRCARGYS